MCFLTCRFVCGSVSVDGRLRLEGRGDGSWDAVFISGKLIPPQFSVSDKHSLRIFSLSPSCVMGLSVPVENYSTGGNYFRMADNSHSKRASFIPRNHYLFCSGNHACQRIFGDRCCLCQPRVAAKEKVGSPKYISQLYLTFLLNSSSSFVCKCWIEDGLHNKLKSLIVIMLWRTWFIGELLPTPTNAPVITSYLCWADQPLPCTPSESEEQGLLGYSLGLIQFSCADPPLEYISAWGAAVKQLLSDTIGIASETHQNRPTLHIKMQVVHLL